ncbi:putative RND superfamily exporter protein [Aerococcus sp. 150760007-1]|uniref:DUF4355 domain-containing protein n=1 Tax=Aerococcus urinaeequi TaxID=51665 RepID=A0ABR5ZYA6_9LACT|nr:DUF4355 domain-containing protein [Aerococcus urinaeequi]MBA5746688.1 DUF4355 domain-containing protein [Aerococcus urinaeequi]MBA5829517.1 DUF4355 domain-containing protein [Aerococcus urinaeequi]MBA5860376.1 DUF4355 domain-containing protein [Aerococcus urinaeequi]
MKFNLQYFAEDNEPIENGGDPVDETINNAETADDNETPELKYSDEDVDKIVQKKLAKAKKDKEAAVEEATKLAKMNEDQKAEYDREQLEKELAELRRKDAFYNLSKEASKMLAEHDITADDELLQVVVKDDAEGTKQAVESFVNLFNAKVKEGVKQALAGNSPKYPNTGKQLTKQQIMDEKDATKRVKLIQQNPQLFKQ